MKKKKMKCIYSLSIVFFIVLALAALSKPAANAGSVKVKKIILYNKEFKKSGNITIKKGDKLKLKTKVVVSPNKAGNKKIIFSSANKKVAAVSSKGVLKGVSCGKTKVTAAALRNRKVKAVINVKVVSGKPDISKDVTAAPTVADATVVPTVTPTAKPLPTVTPLPTATPAPVVKEVERVAKKTTGYDLERPTNFGGTPQYDCPEDIQGFSAQISRGDAAELRISEYNADKLVISDKSQVEIFAKSSTDSDYDKKLSIKSIEETSNHMDKVYNVYLADDSILEDGQEVKIIITLSETSSIKCTIKYVEFYYTRNYERTYAVAAGYKFKARFEYGTGFSECTIDNLPNGLTAVYKDGILCIDGTPQLKGTTTSSIMLKTASGELWKDEAVFDIK